MHERPWSSWQGNALIVGSGGIGRALAEGLPSHAPALKVWTAGRREGGDHHLQLDLEEERSVERFTARVRDQVGSLRLVICTAGLLHEGSLQPEKRLSQVRLAHLQRSFAVNAWGPLLLAQAIEPLLPRDVPSHFASLSARVGSIGDNRLGGWYAYRAAKAAQNQFLTTLALEWRRRLPLVCVTLLHPGTTATPLSEPFRSSVVPGTLFTPAESAERLLTVLAGQSPERSGAFLAWDGRTIPW
ncbi:MAG: SDR family NAD(P)-dependent oxidoreductase [Cyanobium sp.]